jgi:plastocyanin domain-containing protein
MKALLISLTVAGLVAVGGVLLFKERPATASADPVDNVGMVGGKQVIEVRVKGGYSPGKSIARAGVPTILRLQTSGTFDCTASLRIPGMGVSLALPPSGTQDVDLGTPKPGVVEGVCSMGMYSFEIIFQDQEKRPAP